MLSQGLLSFPRPVGSCPIEFLEAKRIGGRVAEPETKTRREGERAGSGVSWKSPPRVDSLATCFF